MWHRLILVAPRDNDALTMRRGRALAVVMLAFIVITSLGAVISLVAGDSLASVVIMVSVAALVIGIYMANRAGHVRTAIWLFLGFLGLLPWSFVVGLKTPVPPVFFLALAVVAAAVFGRPRTPLLVAAALTGMPVLFNVYLYGSPLPPMESPVLPGGHELPPILIIELNAIILLWLIAGGGAMATHLLHEALAASMAASREASAAHESLSRQRADLAMHNAELVQARANLEALVRDLAVPVIPIDGRVGLLPLVGMLGGDRMHEIEQRTLADVFARRIETLVIDLSGARNLDLEVARSLAALCAGLRLLGTDAILCGIKPEAALLLSEAKVPLPPTSASLQEALALFADQRPTERLATR